MHIKAMLGMMFAVFIFSFGVLENSQARETDTQPSRVAHAQPQGQPADNPQGIIDPLFQPGPNANANPRVIRNENTIIDPLFQPNPSANARPQGRPSGNPQGIIDPLFQPNPSGPNANANPRAVKNENGIIDPLFQPNPKSRKNKR